MFHYAAVLKHTAPNEQGPYIDGDQFKSGKSAKDIPAYVGKPIVRGSFADLFKGVEIKECDAYAFFLYKFYLQFARNDLQESKK